MNVLSIGNSFSQDAQRYLHQIAKADGEVLKAYNLYIGGCPLSRHYRNMLSDQKVYDLQINGMSTGFNVSLSEALLNRDWDVITLQQASVVSPQFETYRPYLEELAAYVRECVPKAKLVIHQTWAYEENSPRLTDELGYQSAADMFADIKEAYRQAADAAGADLLIPSGALLLKLSTAVESKVHRDTFHASYGLGRYALGLLWYTMLTGKSVADNTYQNFDEEISAEEIAIAKQCVESVAEEYRQN